MRNILTKGCVLYSEVEFLLHQELRETPVYNAIIEAVALGSTKLNDISQKSSVFQNYSLKCLQILVFASIFGHNIEKTSVIFIANTSAVYVRIDKDLKEHAESILGKLGISPSSAVQMLYSQIVLTRGLPFDLHLPDARPAAIGGMSREELDTELMKGIESLQCAMLSLIGSPGGVWRYTNYL